MTNNRVDGVTKKLDGHGLDAILITNSFNRRYVSGFTGSAGALLLTSSDQWLITDFRYMSQAPQQAAGFTVVEHTASIIATVAELAASAGVQRLGFEQDHVVFSEYRAWQEALGDIELVPVSGVVEGLRMIKEECELAVMRDAAALADDTYRHILGFIKPGISEREVALEMEMYMRGKGATSTSFETIVASGERSALPHGVASDRIIGSNEFVKLDFGAYYGGYCSDLTRTIVVGSPTDRHREIYAIVLEAQLAALAAIAPGMTGREADAIARDVIAKYGYGDCFGHGTGHGLGMEIHEAPRLSKTGDTILEPGMTVTVEPGIYIPGFGGVRIEDDIVITKSGNSLLTSSPKELHILG
ncbi:Xaa-Pro peptidase family protein [Paenibacillus oenotherae]|uniref:Xaa-Pro peptidase family protein n=1 Tax=Paenibacillus oenotherae TaxID=1435645 RepID=A0ABS7D102_9BACL|nr:Xaa-Pro peptidase family protein [Paenibacillus oenotherae]MBW7473568.1 Xaa-Pro peptidase family protein [Paenibacillus oenotherae]